MDRECIASAAHWLRQNTDWSPTQQQALAALAPTLLQRLPRRRPWLVGIGGAPGTGKSTLAKLLANLASSTDNPGNSPFVLSLDDYYLPRNDRIRLARDVHPLLAQRGVPGTHDLDRLFRDLDALADGREARIETPRFDKGLDDRLHQPRILETRGEAGGVILEGWFVGLPPQSAEALASPASLFEASRDPDGAWRKRVNHALDDFEQRFSRRKPRRWLLCPPDWDTVAEWRWRQEQVLPPNRRLLKDRDAVGRFLQPFERLVRLQLAAGQDIADEVLLLDRQHCPRLQSRS